MNGKVKAGLFGAVLAVAVAVAAGAGCGASQAQQVSAGNAVVEDLTGAVCAIAEPASGPMAPLVTVICTLAGVGEGVIGVLTAEGGLLAAQTATPLPKRTIVIRNVPADIAALYVQRYSGAAK